MRVESQEQHSSWQTPRLEKARNDRNNLIRGPWQYVKSQWTLPAAFPNVSQHQGTKYFLISHQQTLLLSVVVVCPFQVPTCLTDISTAWRTVTTQHYQLPLTSHSPARWDESLLGYLRGDKRGTRRGAAGLRQAFTQLLE